MAKRLMGGMTDYSHQSFNDLIEVNIAKVKSSGYWNSKVSSDFIRILAYSLKHNKTAQEKLSEILNEIQIELREHHCKRLQRLEAVAEDINLDIGRIWHQVYKKVVHPTNAYLAL